MTSVVLYCRDVSERDKCPCADFHSGSLCIFTLRSWGITHTLQAEIENRWFWLLSPQSNRRNGVVHFEFREPDYRMAYPVFSYLIRKNGSLATFWYVSDVEKFSRRRVTQHTKHGRNHQADFRKKVINNQWSSLSASSARVSRDEWRVNLRSSPEWKLAHGHISRSLTSR